MILATRIFAPEAAAAAFRLNATAQALVDAGIGVEVFTSQAVGEGAGARRPRPGLRVRRWPVKRDEEGLVRGYAEYLSFDIPLAFRLLFAARPDAIIAEPPPTTGLVALAVAKLRRAPFVYFLPDVWSVATKSAGYPPAVSRALAWAERTLMRNAAAVLTVSEEMGAKAAEALGLPAENMTVVGNGADDSVFRPDGETVEARGPLFVHAGTLSEWQGAGVLVEAFGQVVAAHPRAKLVFLGQGTQRRALEERARQVAPGSIEFVGLVPPAEAARWLRSATAALACAAPGSEYSQTIRPTKVWAATACGTPVIFVGPGPMSREVPAKRLGVAADYDPQAVAGAMIALADEPYTRAARRRLATWTLKNASLTAVGRRAAETVAPLVAS